MKEHKKSKKIQKIRHFFQNAFVYFVIFVTQFFSVRMNQLFAQKLALFVLKFNFKEKRIAYKNCRACFPDASEERIEEIVKKNAQSLMQTLFEVLCIKKIKKNPQKYIQFENIALLKQEKKSALLLFAHYGNWELISLIPDLYDIPSIAIASPLSNKTFNQLIIGKRENSMMKIIEKDKKDTARRLVTAIKENNMMIFGIDLDAKMQSTFVPFFDMMAKTTLAPAKLALRSNLPIYFALGARDDKGFHHVKVDLLCEPPYDQIDEVQITAQFTAFLEKKIKKAPENWAWFINRWKSKAI